MDQVTERPKTHVERRGTTETRDGMVIDWDVPIPMDDGLVLRADIYRPVVEGRYPVILSYGPYAKWLLFKDGYSTAWDIMVKEHPDVPAGSTNGYQSWEVVDPEKWVPDGYVIVRVDSRGAGRSPGYIDPFSPRETLDIYHCIEWAAVQPWSTGKIGMAGISYYAINQWQVAGLQPPHLAAICIWEGAGDWYRDKNHHGGILCSFQTNWYDMQVKTVQHGLGTRRAGQQHQRRPGVRAGDPVAAGARKIPLRLRRRDRGACAGRQLSPRPFGRLGQDHGAAAVLRQLGRQLAAPARQHRRLRARRHRKQKWLEVHGDRHWTLFYTDYGNELQKRFFGHFLKGENTGWDKQPPSSCRSVIRARNSSSVTRTNGRWRARNGPNSTSIRRATR